ncbi:phosphatase PAP2 family protein [Flexivirga oryzae]|uniref:Undecaprenyl-diphosphatase n=1 Tax=Flexivirga oryzae TaxID=1794944 RepID=A0A839N2X0_9MICO|nr:phosphatase PAP2 family protein [Flexivirga oryzae]MBB2892080.1 undecaprenyl-diphosphatase [Flexivirga oryzae]
MNLNLFWQINHFAARTGWAHPVMAAFALWGGLVLLVVILAVAWAGHRDSSQPARTAAATVLAGVSAVVALGVNQVVAAAHFEARPFVAHHGVTVLLHHAADNAFPSDHATIAGALAAGILVFARRWGLLAILVALFLAFARVYVGVHYPDDVVVGLALGAVVTVLLWAGLGRLLTKTLQDRLPPAGHRLIGSTQPQHTH